MRSGLLGRTLKHSYSPEIHAMFGNDPYDLFEREPEDVEAFVKKGGWDGINVTIPYKKTVIPYVDELSETARAVGSVNTMVRKNGAIYGDNTDVFGFLYLLKRSGIDYAGAKTLVLGSGGASVSVSYALRTVGIEPVIVSRSGENNYENLDLHADAELIVNTTPVGMYPENGKAPLSLRRFPRLRGVIDIIYNPARTALLLEAESLGIPNTNGLSMLVAQAAKSREIFTGEPATGRIEDVLRKLSRSMENIVLIGMPGCGKSTVGRRVASLTGRTFVDLDEEIVKRAGAPIPEIFQAGGEERFRVLETETAAEWCKKSGLVIATGGGIVTREENYPLLHENSGIVWLKRDLSALPTNGRPLSQSGSLHEMYQKRAPLYERFADTMAENTGTVDETAAAVLDALGMKTPAQNG